MIRGNSSGYSGKANEPAMRAFGAIETYYLKSKIIREVVNDRIPQDMADELDTLLVSLRKRSNERHKVAHAQWGVTDEFPDDLIREAGVNSHERYTAADFADIEQRLNQCVRDILMFHSRCVAHVAEPPEEFPEPKLSLRQRLSRFVARRNPVGKFPRKRT